MRKDFFEVNAIGNIPDQPAKIYSLTRNLPIFFLYSTLANDSISGQ